MIRTDLTRREHEVLAEIVEGHGNSEIAEALKLSESSIDKYVTEILRKTGCKTRIQLVVRYYKGKL